MLDAYVDAVAARAPARLTVAPRHSCSPRTGSGSSWATASGTRPPAAAATRCGSPTSKPGQAVLMGTIREADTPAILVVRLKVRDRSQSPRSRRWSSATRAAAKSLDTIGTPRAVWAQAVPAAERHSRADLVRIANLYFSGIERNDGKGRIRLPTRARGSRTAPSRRATRRWCRRGAAAPTAASGPARPRSGCRQQFESGVFHYVTRIRDRRFVLVDPERGLAFAFAFFDNAAGRRAVSARWPTAARSCRARACRGRGRSPRCSGSRKGSSARWSRCSTPCPMAWARAGARGSRRCPASHSQVR